MKQLKLSTALIAHTLALVIQYGNLASGLVPPKAQLYVALLVGVAQAFMGFLQHYSTLPAIKPTTPAA